MAARRIREMAPVEHAGKSRRPSDDAVDFMIRFEQRYGGLWYRAIGANGMEHGLEGEATLYETDLGLALPGIVDGDWTWRVNVLTDGRTMMDLGRGIPARIIDSNVEQRIESHALLSEVRQWPHRVFSLNGVTQTVREALGDDLPPVVPEATGPANRWWFDGHHAVFAMLRSWWNPASSARQEGTPREIWTIWCFARDANDLAEAAADLRQRERTWCILCQGRCESGGVD
jgi:hypothetical protein